MFKASTVPSPFLNLVPDLFLCHMTLTHLSSESFPNSASEK